MYFENALLNFLAMLGIIFLIFLMNLYLNRHARFLMKYTSSLKLNSKELIDKFSKDENIKLDSYPSKGNNDLDNYIQNNNCIFINSRHYFSSSFYTLARTIYFCSMSKVAKDNYKKYKFQNRIDSIFTLIDVLAWGIGFIGLLLKMNIFIIIGLSLLFVSFVFTMINLKTIKLYHQISLEYLKKIIKDKKEISIINIIYKYDYYQYILKPFLSLVKLFPILLSTNQKKAKSNSL